VGVLCKADMSANYT